MELADIVPSSLLLFLLLTVLNIFFSRHSLRNPQSHGFYRFFIFEGVGALLVLHYGPAFADPAPLWRAYLAQSFNMTALLFVAAGYLQLRRAGGHHHRLEAPANYAFENTAQLVTSGIYRYIRHPMYSSLLLYAWGLFLNRVSWPGALVVLLTSAVLWKAVRVEEQENLNFFGEAYSVYMRQTRRFFPYLL